MVAFLAVGLPSAAIAADAGDRLSLDQAIEIALLNNIEKTISQQSVAIAEAQYQQALSARWPTLTAKGQFQRRDEGLSSVTRDIKAPLGTLSTAISAALGGAAVPSSVVVPAKAIQQTGRDTAIARLEITYPIYTGGKINSVINQANLSKAIAQEEARRTQLQVVRDVKRYYYAAQLTKTLYDNAKETVEMLESTADLTKRLVEGGSETVNKLDYLKTKMAVSSALAAQQSFDTKHQSALAALTNTMGLDWNSHIKISEPLVVNTKVVELQKLIDKANVLNPQMGMLALPMQVADAKIVEAKSDYFPQVTFTGNTQHIDSNFNGGLTNATNRNSWTLGIGVKLALFDGWLTKSRVNQAKLARMQVQEKLKLARQGLATVLQNLFIELDGANKQVKVAERNNADAEEHTDLTSRAFAIGVTEPEDMVESQLMGAVVKEGLYKAQHDQLLKMAEIEYALGAGVNP